MINLIDKYSWENFQELTDAGKRDVLEKTIVCDPMVLEWWMREEVQDSQPHYVTLCDLMFSHIIPSYEVDIREKNAQFHNRAPVDEAKRKRVKEMLRSKDQRLRAKKIVDINIKNSMEASVQGALFANRYLSLLTKIKQVASSVMLDAHKDMSYDDVHSELYKDEGLSHSLHIIVMKDEEPLLVSHSLSEYEEACDFMMQKLREMYPQRLRVLDSEIEKIEQKAQGQGKVVDTA